MKLDMQHYVRMPKCKRKSDQLVDQKKSAVDFNGKCEQQYYKYCLCNKVCKGVMFHFSLLLVMLKEYARRKLGPPEARRFAAGWCLASGKHKAGINLRVQRLAKDVLGRNMLLLLPSL